MMNVEDVMTRDVVFVEVPGSRDTALKIMKDKGITSVPVVKNRTLVGILTRGDIFRNPEEDQIALLMTRQPVFVSPTATIKDAVRLFIENAIRRMPVVDDSQPSTTGIRLIAFSINKRTASLMVAVGDTKTGCLVIRRAI